MVKSKQVLVDSNIWIGLYHESDSLHEQARTTFFDFEQKQTELIITNFIIQEVFNILSLRSSQAAALHFYQFITHHDSIHQIDIEYKLIERTIRFMIKHQFNQPLGLVDYSILYLHYEFGFQVMSLDQQLMKLYQQLNQEI